MHPGMAARTDSARRPNPRASAAPVSARATPLESSQQSLNFQRTPLQATMCEHIRVAAEVSHQHFLGRAGSPAVATAPFAGLLPGEERGTFCDDPKRRQRVDCNARETARDPGASCCAQAFPQGDSPNARGAAASLALPRGRGARATRARGHDVLECVSRSASHDASPAALSLARHMGAAASARGDGAGETENNPANPVTREVPTTRSHLSRLGTKRRQVSQAPSEFRSSLRHGVLRIRASRTPIHPVRAGGWCCDVARGCPNQVSVDALMTHTADSSSARSNNDVSTYT